MIAVDTSALMAIILLERHAAVCAAALTDNDVIVSAGTLTEALVVAAGRGVAGEMQRLIDDIGMEVVPVTLDSAQRAAAAYARWGKGFHSAALNFGDCFAYEVAKDRGCPLLYVGKDFAKTDIKSVL
jgi:ribonuclease VapC